jgi:N12 class adenine-specific DNA methylase
VSLELARACAHALETLKDLDEDQPPTTRQLEALRGWKGWGPLAPALERFTSPDRSWADLKEQVTGLLTPSEEQIAIEATATAYYTVPEVAKAIWGLVTRLGFTGGRVLEPGCGNGIFFDHAPPGLDCAFTGVDMDPIAAGIARLLHPSATIINAPLERSALPMCGFDLVIGNVPFADVSPWDPAWPETEAGFRPKLHNYFLWRAIETTRPGGLVCLITSRWTMDGLNPARRRFFSENAAFVGAIRLPTGMFDANGTKVVCDIVVLRRRTGDEPGGPGAWENAHTDNELATSVNDYWAAHPDMALGRFASKGGVRTGHTLDVIPPPGADRAALLERAVAVLVDDARARGMGWEPSQNPLPDLELTAPTAREGAHTLHADGTVTRIEGGKPVTVRATAELKELLLLRDAATALFDAEGDVATPDSTLRPLRDHCRHLYERYVKRFGPLNRSVIRNGKPDPETGLPTIVRATPPLGGIRIDPDWPTLTAIEDWNDDTGKAKPAQILLRRVNRPVERKTSTDSPAETVALVRDELGRFDLARAADMLGCQSPAEAAERLAGLIFQDPSTLAWEAAEEYLSGDVRAKLRAAKTAAETDPDRWGGNVAELEKIQPVDVGPFEINAKLGAPWLPTSDVEQFIAELFEVPVEYTTVKHEPYTATWEVTAPYARNKPSSYTTWGTARVNGVDLIAQALNGAAPVVYDKTDVADPDHPGKTKEVRVRNNEQTQLAEDRQKAIQDEFAGWLWADPERTDRLVRFYNDTYNATRLRRFDGSGYTFPGLADWFKPYDHQRDMVARIIGTKGATLCGYGVGAGKTAIMAVSAMKLKELGLARKSSIIVPNHLLEQVAGDCRRLYPGAKVLMVTKKDLTKERRKAFAAKVAAQDWDLVVMTHTQFQAIPVSPTIEARYVEELIRQYEKAMFEGEDLDDSRVIKRLGKQIMKLKARHARLMHMRRDDGLYFDRLGIDMLFVDECFPAETPVLTDRGWLPIGEIVEKGLRVNIASVNTATGRTEWKPVQRWVKKAHHGPMIRIVHEHGEFTCTPNHPIWVEGRGYVKAEDVANGSVLRLVRDDLRPEHPQAEVLRPAVPDCGRDRPAEDPAAAQSVRAMPGGVRAELRGSAVLREPVRGGVADDAAGPRGAHPAHAAGGTGGAAGAVPAGLAGADAGQQSDAGPGRASEGVVFAPGANVVVGPWRSGDRDGSAADVGRPAGTPDGIHYQDPASGASVRVAAELVRRGSSAPGIEDGDRGGWELAQDTPVALPGSEEDGGLGSARVVGVEVLEPRSADGDGPGRGGDHFVYNLEVADNHNYFADGVLVSNCHFFKNLAAPTRMEGFNMPGSKRAEDLHLKIGWLRSRNPDGRCAALFTGTPITNTLAEAYTLLRYLDPELLLAKKMASFDAFAGMFIVYESRIEVAPDGSGFRMYRRPSKFTNVPALKQMLGRSADIRSRKKLQLAGPKNVRRKLIEVEPPPELADIIEELVRRADDIRGGKVRPDEDNMLAVCGEGRLAALDVRLLDYTPTGPGKVDAVAANVAEVYHAHKNRVYPPVSDDEGVLWAERPGAFQLVFCDLGTPGKAKGDQAYGWLKAQMVARGVPADQIRYIHEASSDADKKAMFAACRDGRFSVLIASTEKAGTGVNIQHRLVAIHHVDCTWRPDGIEQRDGRGDRPGNENDTLWIFQYVTLRSFDPYMWQGCERKMRMIDQITDFDLVLHEVVDVPSEQEQYFAMIKAVATGQERVMELEQAKAEVARFQTLATAHSRDQIRLKVESDSLSATMWDARRTARLLVAIAETAQGQPRVLERYSHNGGDITTDEAMCAELGARARKVLSSKRDAWLGRWRGIELALKQSWVKGKPAIGFTLSAPRTHDFVPYGPVPGAHRKGGAAQLLREIDRVIDRAGRDARAEESRATYLEAKVAELAPMLGTPFAQRHALDMALQRRAEIEAEIEAQLDRQAA